MRLDRFRVAVTLSLIVAAAAAVPFSSPVGAAAKGKIVLAWHAGFASRWLDPQEHDGTATPDNFFTALHDALIKNQGTQLYDHLALAERFTVAADAKSATFWRPTPGSSCWTSRCPRSTCRSEPRSSTSSSTCSGRSA